MAKVEDMNKVLNFFETASKRSVTMVNNLLDLPLESGKPVAIIIGAAHTDQVLRELKSRDVKFVQITSIALNPSYGNLSNEAFDRKNNTKWARINPGTLGGILDTQRKPPPTVETLSAHSYASMIYASILIAQVADEDKTEPNGKWTVPTTLLSQLSSLPEFKVDQDSFLRNGKDVIFRASLKDTNGRDKEVWARVGTQNTPTQARDLEAKLHQAIADLSGDRGGRIPPRKPPSNSEPAKDEGPGDGKRQNIIINRLNDKVVAVFGDKDKVTNIAKISG